MEYSRIRNALNKGITIPSCSPGKICELPDGIVNIAIIHENFAVSLEIVNKKIIKITSQKSSKDNINVDSFKTKIDNTGYLWFDYYSGSTTLSGKFTLDIEYTSGIIKLPSDTSSDSAGYADSDEFNFSTIYHLAETRFHPSTNEIAISNLTADTLAVNSIVSNSTTINASNANISAGTLIVKQARLETAHVNTFEANQIETSSIKIGNWILEEKEEHDDVNNTTIYKISIKHPESNS